MVRCNSFSESIKNIRDAGSQALNGKKKREREGGSVPSGSGFELFLELVDLVLELDEQVLCLCERVLEVLLFLLEVLEPALEGLLFGGQFRVLFLEAVNLVLQFFDLLFLLRDVALELIPGRFQVFYGLLELCVLMTQFL
jgi:hypothetical protein